MLKPSLQLRLSQQLTMTPQLQQAIRLLQLPIMELSAQIQDALEQNVMLEEVPIEARENGSDSIDGADGADGGEAAEPAETVEGPEVDVASDAEWEDRQTTNQSETVRSNEPGPDWEQADRSNESLREHLLWQLEMENLGSVKNAIGQALIDAINDDGYLTDDLETIRATLAPEVLVPIDEIEAVLALVQNFDPAGVGAQSVSECVLIQLDQLDPSTPGLELAKAIAAEHLELMAQHQFSALRRVLATTEEALETALMLVRSCHPRPGAAVYAPQADYVVPDVFVRKVDGRWVVELNGALAPRLRVNQIYASSLGRGEEYDALKGQLQEARWLIRSLEIRNETLLKVAQSIVRRQTEFLEHGEEHMRPMVLRDVAEAIEMHESTVSRVTTNKFMHTPRGIFEFRYFFSSHVAGDDGEQSSTAVRAKIRKLIAAESPDKPLSDSKVAAILSEDGVQVARRTVAKYRESMKIPSSSDRKKSKLQI